MAPFLQAHGYLRYDHTARMTDKTTLRAEGRHEFAVQQILVDPEDENDWGIQGFIDLRDDQASQGPMITIVRFHGA